MEQELIKSNEMLATQVWILGGTIIGLLALLGFFARGAWMDMKAMLSDHDKRIDVLERHKERTEERHVNNGAVIEQIRTKLDLLIDRG